MGGKIQNADIKSLSELTSAGATAAELINDTKIYLTANGLNKQLSAAITDGSIGGGGSTNLITDGNGEAGTTNYIEGSYSAATRPSGTFTASSGAGAFAISTTTTNPLDGTNSFLLTKSSGASRQGRAVERTISIASKYQGRTMEAFIDYRIVSGSFVAGSNGSSPTDSSLIFYIAQSPNGSTWTFTEPQNFKLLSNSTTLSDQYVGQFQVLSDTTQVKIIAYVAETANSDWVLELEWGLRPTIYSSIQTRGPVGTIIPFGSVTPPQGFLYCDGSAVSRAQYSKLFTTIGTSYGSGDGSTTFNLPDLRGVFLRGAGSQTFGSVTYSGTLGTKQNDQFQTHGHSVSDPGHTHTLRRGPNTDAYYNMVGGTSGEERRWEINSSQSTPTSPINSSGTNLSVTSPNSGRTGSETYPANVSVAYHICYDDGTVEISDGYDGRIFAAYANRASNLTINTSATDVLFDTVINSSVISINTSTGECTILSAGWYEFTSNIRIDSGGSAPGQMVFEYVVNGGSNIVGAPTDFVANKAYYFNPTFLNEFKANDKIKLRITSATNASTLIGGQNGWFIKKLSGSQTTSIGSRVSARYENSVAQSIPASSVTNNTVVDFATKKWDTHNAVSGTGSGVGGSWKFTAPFAGEYQISLSVRSATGSWSAGQEWSALIFKNGTYNNQAYYMSTQNTASYSIAAIGTQSVELNAGEYISVGVYQNSGGARNTDNNPATNWIEIKRIK